MAGYFLPITIKTANCVCVCFWETYFQLWSSQARWPELLWSGSSCRCGLEGERRIVGGEDSTVLIIRFVCQLRVSLKICNKYWTSFVSINQWTHFPNPCFRVAFIFLYKILKVILSSNITNNLFHFQERQIPLDCDVERGTKMGVWRSCARLRSNPCCCQLGRHCCSLHCVSKNNNKQQINKQREKETKKQTTCMWSNQSCKNVPTVPTSRC